MQSITDISAVFEKYNVQKYAVQPLTYRFYKLLDITTAVWSEKTDGERTVFAFTFNGLDYVIETEKYKTNKALIYYIFDIDVFESKLVQDIPFIERFKQFNTFLKLYNENYNCPLKYDFRIKSFYSITLEGKYLSTFPLSPYVSSFKDLYDFVYDHHKSPSTNDIIDGVIIQTDNRVYKYKRDVLNTNDFYIKRVSQNKFLLYAWNGKVNKNAGSEIKINYRFHKHRPKDTEYYIPNHTLFVSPFCKDSYFLDVSKPITVAERKLYFSEEARNITLMMKDMMKDNFKYNDTIVELSWTGSRWLPMRIRPDKDYANYYGICINNASISYAPIDPYEADYFNKITSDSAESSSVFTKDLITQFHDISKLLRISIYECIDSFMNDTSIGKYKPSDSENKSYQKPRSNEFVTEMLLESMEDREITFDYNKPKKNHKSNNPKTLSKPRCNLTVVDLAGGRGGDLITLLRLGCTNLIAVDNDRPALAWYASKAFETDERFYFNAVNCNINSDLDTDESLQYLKDLPEFPKAGADILFYNFAIHYSIQYKQNIKMFIKKCLKKEGSIFVYTYFDSEACKQLSDSNKFKPTQFMKDGFEYVNMPVPTIDKEGFRAEPAVNTKLLKGLVDEKEFEVYEYDDILCEDSIDKSKTDADLIEYFKCLRLRICYKGHAKWKDEEISDNVISEDEAVQE